LTISTGTPKLRVMSSHITTIANEIETLESQLAAKKREMAAALGLNGATVEPIPQVQSRGVQPRPRPVSNGNSPSVSDVARGILKTGPHTFSVLWDKVQKKLPDASKFALRSFVTKAKDREEIVYRPGKGRDDGLYVLAAQAQQTPAVQVRKPAKKKAPSGSAGGASGVTTAVAAPHQEHLF